MQRAADVYLRARWSKLSEKDALAEADAAMRGRSLAPCSDKEHTPLEWPRVRKAMVALLAEATPR